MAQFEAERTNRLGARLTIVRSCSFHWPRVERRRHCRLTDPDPVPLPGRGRRAASLDALPTASDATGGIRTPAATATTGRARPSRERPRLAWLFS
jgi:hypothetical protein